jgi:hypothetical protein
VADGRFDGELRLGRPGPQDPAHLLIDTKSFEMIYGLPMKDARRC